MSTFRVPVEISALEGHEYVTTEALVDTGATHSGFPEDFLEGLGIKPTGTRQFKLANEERVTRVIGEARIRCTGITAACIVIFVGKDASPLLGATTLENLGLSVDPINERLVPSIIEERPF